MRGTVLVTGGAGAVGSAVIEALGARGWTVRALVHLRPVPAAGEAVLGDLGDAGSLDRAVRGADAVLHLAAVTHARRAREYERVNLSGTRSLLAAAERGGVRRFVFVSTRAATSLGGAYSRSKLLAEDAVRKARLGQVVVRLPELLTGRGQEGVDRVVDAARRGAPVAVVGAGDDEVCPILLEDAIQPLLSALEREGVEGKTYTLAGECLTVREFARLCIKSFDSSSRIVRVPRLAVAALSPLAAVLPLPFYPDQLARLRTAKPPPSPEAREDLGFRPRSVREALEVGTD